MRGRARHRRDHCARVADDGVRAGGVVLLLAKFTSVRAMAARQSVARAIASAVGLCRWHAAVGQTGGARGHVDSRIVLVRRSRQRPLGSCCWDDRDGSDWNAGDSVRRAHRARTGQRGQAARGYSARSAVTGFIEVARSALSAIRIATSRARRPTANARAVYSPIVLRPPPVCALESATVYLSWTVSFSHPTARFAGVFSLRRANGACRDPSASHKHDPKRTFVVEPCVSAGSRLGAGSVRLCAGADDGALS